MEDVFDSLHEFLVANYKNNTKNVSIVSAFNSDMSLITNRSTFSPYNKLKGSKIVFGSIVLISSYAILMLISLFGNSVICFVVLRNKKMYTVTNFFIANMAISDLFVTCFNVPFNIARFLLVEWPFGSFFCHLMNYSLMVSVYVSTFTLTFIALDRQYMLLYPLKPRMSKRMGLILLVFLWIISSFLSLPYGLYTEVQEVNFIVSFVKRCQPSYPEPKVTFKKCLTLTTTFLQYFIPLVVISVSYGRIVRRLWLRTHLGAVTHSQQLMQSKAKKRSIKLLITVVIIFALCWLPLNLYHILTTFHPNKTLFRDDSTTFFILHWIAISSTCYNPFIYCWMNATFRLELKRCFGICKRVQLFYTRSEISGLLQRSDTTSHKRNQSMSTMVSTNLSTVPFSNNNSSDSNRNSKHDILLNDMTPT